MNLSAVVLTKNEEKNLKICLSSLSICDEIIVVDDDSTDKTTDIAGEYHAKIINHKMDNNDFSGQREYGVEQASNDWVLFIDADEKLSPELQAEIQKLNLEDNKSDISAYYIKRRDWWWGRELRFGETMSTRNNGIIRLIKKGSGKWEGKVHETYKINSGQKSTLNGFLEHNPHPTISEFLKSINYYSSIRAQELHKQGKRVNIWEIVLYPLFKFKYTYCIKLGFLDGPAGFVYAFMMSFHSFLVRTKLYQITKLDKNN